MRQVAPSDLPLEQLYAHNLGSEATRRRASENLAGRLIPTGPRRQYAAFLQPKDCHCRVTNMPHLMQGTINLAGSWEKNADRDVIPGVAFSPGWIILSGSITRRLYKSPDAIPNKNAGLVNWLVVYGIPIVSNRQRSDAIFVWILQENNLRAPHYAQWRLEEIPWTWAPILPLSHWELSWALAVRF